MPLPKRSVGTLTLTPELMAAVEAHMRDAGISDKRAAVVDLIRQGLAVSPKDGAIKAARERAYFLAKRWLIGRTQRFLEESAQQILIDLSTDSELDGGTDVEPIDPSKPFPAEI